MLHISRARVSSSRRPARRRRPTDGHPLRVGAGRRGLHVWRGEPLHLSDWPSVSPGRRCGSWLFPFSCSSSFWDRQAAHVSQSSPKGPFLAGTVLIDRGGWELPSEIGETVPRRSGSRLFSSHFSDSLNKRMRYCSPPLQREGAPPRATHQRSGLPISQWWPNGSAIRPMRQP